MNEISITLTGSMAQAYIDGDSNTKLIEEHNELKKVAKELGEAYVMLQAKYNALSSSRVSPKVIKDTELSNDLDTPNGFSEALSNAKESIPKFVKRSGKWLKSEIRVLTNGNTLEDLIIKLPNRTEKAIRSKLWTLGISSKT